MRLDSAVVLLFFNAIGFLFLLRIPSPVRFVESTFEGASRENSVGGTIW